MAFPGTYNINYYRGDTLEFLIYPKDSTGETFDLTEYLDDDVTFVIAPTKGTAPSVEGFAEKSNDETYIRCAILPASGATLTAGQSYVYDVKISKTASPYDYVYTLLTGTISVTDRVGV